ncbi:MAG: hypothetical protein NWE97_00665 [Candidatus Bathyarchaeota archaeon]|nr:hypothetical protein [Candidatus Bathyarchaeota archaeon]
MAVKLMPLRVICQKCKFVLYDGKDLKPPYEIIPGYDGRCPNCGKKLSEMPIDFEIEYDKTQIIWRSKKLRER